MARASDDGRPSDGGPPDDLPDLPAEWGVVVVPDDLSELADEVDAIRAELHLAPPPTRWQRFVRRPALRRLHRLASAGLRTPVLIISLAVVITVASLFASAWPGPPRQPVTQRTATTDDHSDTLPALELIGSDGQPVPLRGRLPTVILLVERCDCARLVADTVAAVRPDTTVLTVSAAAPVSTGVAPRTGTPQPQGKTVRSLHDPTDSLRRHLRLSAPDGTAAAVLVNRGGEIVRKVARIATVEEIRPDLARL